VSLILMTSKVLLAYLDVCVLDCFEACIYNLLELLEPLSGLLFLKYLEFQLTSFCDLARIGGGILFMVIGVDLSTGLLL